MITLDRVIIYLQCECELTDGSFLAGTTKVVLKHGYWVIIKSDSTRIVLEEFNTKERKILTCGMLGKLLASRSNKVSFVTKGEIPKTITLQG